MEGSLQCVIYGVLLSSACMLRVSQEGLCVRDCAALSVCTSKTLYTV
jgi:hypothetical protein